MEINFRDIDYLRSLGTPTYFGLGFIQLRMDDTRRFHFWHPDISVTHYDNEWHDHRYNFSSQVIVGSITNEVAFCEETPEGNLEVWEVCCEGNGAEYKTNANVHYQTRFTTHEGNAYFIHMNSLHKVNAEKTMTLQHRYSREYKLKARVVSEKYASPNPFTASLPEPRIWEIIRDVVGVPGYHMRDIPRGELGELSKIREEMDELQDSVAQGARIMQLMEMSDMIGAMEAFMDRHHPGYTMDDLIKMKNITRRAFVNGKRT